MIPSRQAVDPRELAAGDPLREYQMADQAVAPDADRREGHPGMKRNPCLLRENPESSAPAGDGHEAIKQFADLTRFSGEVAIEAV